MTALSDAELLDRARNGNEAAFTELYVRHRDAARRLARSYRRCGDPDDLANGAFERVLAALRRGGGPTSSFRAYLFVTLRRLALEQARRPGDEPVDEVPEPVAAVVDGPDLDSADRQMIAEAFESLPGPWQTVLWQTAVEGRQPRDFAGTVGLSPNAAAALAYRARERLRQAYLQAHVRTKPRRGCEPHRSRLGGYVRGGLNHRHDAATRQHVEHCPSCRELVNELSDVNRLLVRAVVPVFVAAGGATLAARVAAGAGQAAAAASAVSSSGSGGARVLDVALTGVRRAGAVAGTAAAAAAATVALLGVTLIPHDAGPTGGSAPDVRTGAPPLTETQELAADHRPTSTSSTFPGAPGGPGTTGPGGTAPPAGPAGPTTGEAADTTTSSTGAVAGVDTEIGADAEVGVGPVGADVDTGLGVGVQVDESGMGVSADVDATAALGLDLNWLNPVLGNGTLQMLVPNSGQQAALGVKLDVKLSASARVSTVQSGGCAGQSTGNLLGDILALVQSLTCTLGVVQPGATVRAEMQIEVTAPGQTATVSLLRNGQLLTTEVVSLPMG